MGLDRLRYVQSILPYYRGRYQCQTNRKLQVAVPAAPCVPGGRSERRCVNRSRGVSSAVAVSGESAAAASAHYTLVPVDEVVAETIATAGRQQRQPAELPQVRSTRRRTGAIAAAAASSLTFQDDYGHQTPAADGVRGSSSSSSSTSASSSSSLSAGVMMSGGKRGKAGGRKRVKTKIYIRHPDYMQANKKTGQVFPSRSDDQNLSEPTALGQPAWLLRLLLEERELGLEAVGNLSSADPRRIAPAVRPETAAEMRTRGGREKDRRVGGRTGRG